MGESFERRFGALDRLYGAGSTTHFATAHIMIAGIGGVGSWCAEAVARHGTGKITLIDLDHIAESNINRQLPALGSTVGQAKAMAMAERIADINPQAQVDIVDDFVSAENIVSLLQRMPDVLIDCTDQISAKLAMVLAAKRHNVPLIVCGAAGGKRDVLALRSSDLSQTSHDALLARLRNQLRKQHGFPRPKPEKGARIPKMGVTCLWVEESAVMPELWRQGGAAEAPQGLSCAGYGSAVTLTASMGLAAAQLAINRVLSQPAV